MRAFLDLLRLPNIVLSAVTFLVVAIKNSLPLLGVIPTALAVAFGNVVNDIFDRNIDKRRKPWRPLASGKVSTKDAKIIAAILLILAIITSLYSVYAFITVSVALLLLYLYARGGKRIKYLGNILVAALTAAVIAFPFLQVGRLDFPAELVTATFLAMWAREVAKDLEEGERNGFQKIGGKGVWALLFLLTMGAALFAAQIHPALLLLFPVFLVPIILQNATLLQKTLKAAIPVVLLVYWVR